MPGITRLMIISYNKIVNELAITAGLKHTHTHTLSYKWTYGQKQVGCWKK